MPTKKIVITGADGFIGRNLFDFFASHKEYDVWGTYHLKKSFDHPNLIQADLMRREDVSRICTGADIIVHAAAVTSGAKNIVTRAYIYVTDNTIMNTLLFQEVYDRSISRFIFFSCSVMYPMDRTVPVKEEDVDLENGIHRAYFGGAWMKVYAEKICEFYSRLGRTSFTVIRHSNIYGPHDTFDQDKAHVFAATILKVMNGKDSITVWGDGSERRDLLYIDDLIRFVGLALAKQKSPYELVNVGVGRAVSVAELVSRIVTHSGKKLQIHFDPSKPTIPSRLALDYSKARELFNWEPSTTLDDGIKKTLDWYGRQSLAT